MSRNSLSYDFVYRQTLTFTKKDSSKGHMIARVTDVLRKSNGRLIVQEHVSFPVDPETGKADLLSQP